MRTSDVDIILIPDQIIAGDAPHDTGDSWLARWERSLKTARWLTAPAASPDDAAAALLSQVDETTKPSIIVTHGRGVETFLAAREPLGARTIAGAFLVAPVLDNTSFPHAAAAFPTAVVASTNHPETRHDQARQLARDLQGSFIDAGEAGRIDSSSGHGPWPEGLMQFGWFLKKAATAV